MKADPTLADALLRKLAVAHWTADGSPAHTFDIPSGPHTHFAKRQFEAWEAARVAFRALAS